MHSYFWVEAINYANYIQNCMPHKALHLIPEEAWSHVEPDISSFRVFSSEDWVFIPKDEQNSIEGKI